MAKKKEPKKEVRKRRLRALLTKKNMIVGIIVLFFLIQYFQIQSIFGTFSFLEGRDTSLITEIGQIKEAYTQIGDDMTEMRKFLRMPTHNYGGFEEEEAATSGSSSEINEDQLQLALFQYVSYLSDQKRLEKKTIQYKEYFNSLLISEDFLTFLNAEGLNISTLNEDDYSFSLLINTAEGKNLLTYYYSKEESVLYVKNVLSKTDLELESAEDLQTKATEVITAEKADLLATMGKIASKVDGIVGAINSAEVQAVLAEKGISLNAEYTEADLKYTYAIKNKAEDEIGQISFDFEDEKIELVDLNDDSMTLEITDITISLVPFLEKLDTRTFLDKKADEALTSLQDTLLDKGFNLLLSESELSVAATPREKDGRVYYDIFDADENHLSSLVVEKATGVINIVQPDGTNSENILFFDPDFKKKTLELPDEIPDFEDGLSHEPGTFNILICGKHGSLLDTMIFAHADEEKGTVRMISIPRDLYYNGRKINSFAHYYGMPELTRVISDFTGYEIDKYILIDMYAFIDVVDLIGGVDVHLEKSVIDPTYRTVDDGVEGTLHYEPGDYHLGGKEALRLARSRYTSSDFARAERQQLILKSLQAKAQNFGFGDADTIYEIAKSVLGQTETDISLDDALKYYFKFQNYEIESNDVMSSGNVLYVPPYITTGNCQNLIDEAAAADQPTPDCMNQNHAYTLLPRDDNWNVIKWFFKEKFETI